jgi:hypothetical protein
MKHAIKHKLHFVANRRVPTKQAGFGGAVA